jgi:hypothetical protein
VNVEAQDPTSLAGVWLKATLFVEVERHNAANRRLGAVLLSQADHQYLVLTLGLFVRQVFSDAYRIKDVTRYVEQMRELLGADANKLDIPKTEALIRSSLGEPCVEIDDISGPDRLTIILLVIGLTMHQLGLTKADAIALLVEGESQIEGSGLQLTRY